MAKLAKTKKIKAPSASKPAKKAKAAESRQTREAGRAASPLVLAATAGDIQGRIRELIKLAKEQGYLTFDDLNEALPAGRDGCG